MPDSEARTACACAVLCVPAAMALSTWAKSPAAALTPGVQRRAHGVLRRVGGRRREAADLQREIGVVGVVAQARQQEGIVLVDRGKGAGQAGAGAQDRVGGPRTESGAGLDMDIQRAALERRRTAHRHQVGLASAGHLHLIGTARCVEVVAVDGERADRVARRQHSVVEKVADEGAVAAEHAVVDDTALDDAVVGERTVVRHTGIDQPAIDQPRLVRDADAGCRQAGVDRGRSAAADSERAGRQADRAIEHDGAGTSDRHAVAVAREGCVERRRAAGWRRQGGGGEEGDRQVGGEAVRQANRVLQREQGNERRFVGQPQALDRA